MGIDLSFDPADIDANGGTVRGWASSLDMFCARILGRSEDLGAQFDDSAMEFTELVQWDIEGASDEDLQAWRDASGAVRYCAAVTDHWADNIDDFKRERNRLIGLWEDDKKDAEDRIAALGDANLFSSLFCDDKDNIIAELEGKLEEYNAQAKTNWDTLMDNADDRKQELIDGPTPANIRSLIDAGYVNWSMFNIDPVQYAPEISPSEADEWGEKLSEAWKTGQRGEEYDDMMMMLNMLSMKIIEAGNRGTGADRQDQETLKSIYDAIGTHSNGLLNVPYYLDEIEKSKEEQEEILGTLANGILVLSREDLEGGYENLPEDIRDALNSEHWYSGGDVSQGWGADIEPMAAILEHSDEDLMGGKDFSALLTSIVGAGASPEFLHPEGEAFFNDNAGILLDISTRNNEANHAILTDSFYHPEYRNDSEDNKSDYKIDSSEIMEGLFTYDWPDEAEAEGLSVHNLINWISEYGGSSDESQRTMAGEAAAGLIRITTSNDMFEKLTDTVHSVPHDEGDDSYTNQKVSFGQVNPSLSASLYGVFYTYLEEFASEDGNNFPLNEDGETLRTWSLWDSEEEELQVDPLSRVRFLQYIAANEEYTGLLQSAAYTYNNDQLTEYLYTSSGERPTAGTAGILQGLVDAAIYNESMDRLGDSDEARQNTYKTRKLGVDIGAGIISSLPPGRELSFASEILFNSGKVGASEYLKMALDDSIKPEAEGYGGVSLDHLENREIVENHVRLKTLEHMVANGTVSTSEVPQGILAETESGDVRIATEREIQESFSDRERAEIIGQVQNLIKREEQWTGGAFSTGSSFADDYLDEHNLYYEKIVNNLQAENSDEYDNMRVGGPADRPRKNP
ncbi:hypothetical protein NI17_020185 [Thermobifida halotolerans]|uniref:TPR repeat domain-containing protein n=1 Tax=Thermobifida halotolerans TaxID=483545 RepID=A0A399FU25_9ACTN|nr:hypothetical protein [Thermobifida halotolerans]UOE19051.1 hypothetical protein NI17_020185 [Thermobifida halotolerans]